MKPILFGVQGRSTSSMLASPESQQCLLW